VRRWHPPSPGSFCDHMAETVKRADAARTAIHADLSANGYCFSMNSGLQARRFAHTRAEIQAAAFALFERDGFDAITVDQIAERAGVSPRTYFRYFESKSDLIFGVMTIPIERVASALDARPADEASGAAFQGALFDALDSIDDATSAALTQASNIMLDAESLRALAGSAMPARERRLEAAIRARLAPAADPVAARFLATSLNMALWMAMDTAREPVRGPELAARVLTILGSVRMLLDEPPVGPPARLGATPTS
jgi:AcrR family transcriptional regulator